MPPHPAVMHILPGDTGDTTQLGRYTGATSRLYSILRFNLTSAMSFLYGGSFLDFRSLTNCWCVIEYATSYTVLVSSGLETVVPANNHP
ncbi:hypothetical protein NP493_9115g00005 [Ridgeia piscesae]|uniref:Uncharacterized protein n=1 Tax=Ridgeia piscesae TaxID=27915 RepID=A0AAD9INC7_RIDPI|nr:hypothetical protein NP493_9115g00005 [Ridgeia piscesae]